MQLYSRHLHGKGIDIPEHVVVRINLAWYEKDMYVPDRTLFFDYPDGRTKPPLSRLGLRDAIDLASSFDRTKYFAVSNAESHEHIADVRRILPPHIKLVPKIETKRGVNNLYRVIDAAETDMVMLDTEDLYSDAGDEYGEYLDKFYNMVKSGVFYTDDTEIKVLRMQGVIFCDY